MCPKSLYRSLTGRHLYGTENMILAGFGPDGNTEKENWGPIMILMTVFSTFQGQKKNLFFYLSILSRFIYILDSSNSSSFTF
jgi:hypothetical protein